MRKAMRAGVEFIRGWRGAAAAAYRRQHGLYAALPIVWGCLDAYLIPYIAAAGFLATAWFLEGRMGKRLAWQAAIFLAWTLFLGARLPQAESVQPPGQSLATLAAAAGAEGAFPWEA